MSRNPVLKTNTAKILCKRAKVFGEQIVRYQVLGRDIVTSSVLLNQPAEHQSFVIVRGIVVEVPGRVTALHERGIFNVRSDSLRILQESLCPVMIEQSLVQIFKIAPGHFMIAIDKIDLGKTFM